MIRFVAVILTLLSTVLHAAFGCEWHHHCAAHDEHAPSEHEKPHDTWHHDQSNASDDEIPRHPENDDREIPNHHHPCDCAFCCAFVIAPQVNVRVFCLDKSFDLPMGMASADSVTANTQIDSNANFIPNRFSALESVRAHLFHQVWLL